MPDVVEQLIATGRSSRDIFCEAYRTANDPTNWTWAHGIWIRSGIVTATIKEYCERELEPRLPLDCPDYEHLTGAIK